MLKITIINLIALFFLFMNGMNAETQEIPKCDLGAEMIHYEILKQVDGNTVRVKITGKVKNLGTRDFFSVNTQTIVQLSESSMDQEPVFSVKAEKAILSLPVGQFFLIEYERDWPISDLELFSGKPSYLLEIKYSPDILQDGNPDNDDSITKNAKRERTTKELRRIWSTYRSRK